MRYDIRMNINGGQIKRKENRTMIRKAVSKDIDAVEESYRELLLYEKENGTDSNWVLDLYPVRATAEAALNEGTLYVAEEGDIICGSAILNRYQPEGYKEGTWKYEAENVLVIHTLCIPPSKAGRGLGKAFIRFAAELAANNKCDVIRLDTWAGNKKAASLYTKMGFERAGGARVMLAGVIPEDQIFFEKKL